MSMKMAARDLSIIALGVVLWRWLAPYTAGTSATAIGAMGGDLLGLALGLLAVLGVFLALFLEAPILLLGLFGPSGIPPVEVPGHSPASAEPSPVADADA